MFSVTSQTIAATPPLPSIKVAYPNPRTGGVGEKLASEAYRAIGVSHEIVSPIVLEWDTKSTLNPYPLETGTFGLDIFEAP